MYNINGLYVSMVGSAHYKIIGLKGDGSSHSDMHMHAMCHIDHCM